MSEAYECDLCDELFEGCPPVCPVVEYKETRIKAGGSDIGFTDVYDRLLDVCPTCQAVILRLMADELDTEAHE